MLASAPSVHNSTSEGVSYAYSIYSNWSQSENDVEERDPCRYDKHNWLEVKLILISIIGTTIAVFGILGNITTMIVLARPSMRTPNNLFLTFLAIFDTLLLVSAIVLYSIEYIYEYTDSLTLYTVWLQYVRLGFALSHVAQTGSVYITVAVTFERLLAVLYPKRAKTMCTHDRTSISIVVVVAFAVLFNSTKYFEVEVIYVENCTGFGAQHLVPSALLSNDLYTTVHSLWLTQFVMVFIPFIVLFAVNTAIVYRVRRSLKKLSWIQRGRKRDQLKEKSKDATRVLIVIVLVFLLCNALGFVVTLLESLYTQLGLLKWCPGFYAFAREAVNFLAIVNSSINFVIYCLFGQEFRRELVCMWGCKRFTFMMPMGDKITADGLMLNPSLRRSPSMFARYVSLIRQSSAAQLYENGRKVRKRNDDGGRIASLANVKGILASLQSPSNNNSLAGSRRKVIITGAEYDDEVEGQLQNEGSWKQSRKRRVPSGADDSPAEHTRKEDAAVLANGSGMDAYLLPAARPLSKSEKGYGSRSYFALSTWRDRLYSNSKRRRSSSALTASKRSRRPVSRRSDPNDNFQSTPSCSESEPLAPFLLGMLISTTPTVRQAGFERAMKHYENPADEIDWL